MHSAPIRSRVIQSLQRHRRSLPIRTLTTTSQQRPQLQPHPHPQSRPSPPSPIQKKKTRRLFSTTPPLTQSKTIPAPTPFVPDPSTFLSLIGRGLSAHSSKIPSWDALFTLTSPQLKDLGIEPARSRKYLLGWRERYRRGRFGVGGDVQYVNADGVAELGILEREGAVSSSTASHVLSAPGGKVLGEKDGEGIGMGSRRRMVINIPPSASASASTSTSTDTTTTVTSFDEARPIQGISITGAQELSGKGLKRIPGTRGSRALLAPVEGLWEFTRGRKVDGGERRKKEVRAKRAAKERSTR